MYARYTEYLRDLMLNEHTKPLIDRALSTYPLYQSQNTQLMDLIPTREVLNEKLLNHYKYREIGFETVGRFLDELEITMKEIMPRYNELFKTVEIMAEVPSPFDNVDIVETFEQETTQNASTQGTSSQSDTSSQTGTNSQTVNTSAETEGTSTDTASKTENMKSLESDTPQNEINVGTKNISNVSYASQANWGENTVSETESKTNSDSTSSESTSNGTSSTEENSSSEASSSGTSESNATVKHTFTKKGNQGVNTYAHDIKEFRTTIIDIVDQIIHDRRIGELFMLVY